MKKLVLILIIFFTLMLTGVLYGRNHQMVQEDHPLSLLQSFLKQYPATVPEVIFDPLAALPLC